MPLELHPVKPQDLLSWMRVRSLAYYGPTHHVLHSGPIRESSIRAAAQARNYELAKPNMWHWKIVDTDLSPSEDDPPDNGGRTIAIAAWSIVNERKAATTSTAGPTPDDESFATAETKEEPPPPRYIPPELRMDAIASLFGPLRAAQEEIMGTSEPYFMLNSLATHPDHRGKGAAKLLLDWGLRRADELGLATYLDATGMARPMYERRGFEVVREIEWDREPWGGAGRDCHFAMRRRVGREGRGGGGVGCGS